MKDTSSISNDEYQKKEAVLTAVQNEWRAVKEVLKPREGNTATNARRQLVLRLFGANIPREEIDFILNEITYISDWYLCYDLEDIRIYLNMAHYWYHFAREEYRPFIRLFAWECTKKYALTKNLDESKSWATEQLIKHKES